MKSLIRSLGSFFHRTKSKSFTEDDSQASLHKKVSLARSDARFKFKYLTEKETARFIRFSVVPYEILNVPIEKLYVQYRSEWKPPHDKLPEKLIDSPMVKLLEKYVIYGDNLFKEHLLKKTEYYEMFAFAHSVGWRYDWANYPTKIDVSYTDLEIREKTERFIELYNSIKNNGFMGNEFSASYVTILSKPFESTLFNNNLHMDGWEVWGGHHRAAAAWILGIKNIECILCKYDSDIQF